ncbi:MAG: hypothetical protein JWO05_1046 [Gemmatimonadetes bacterium]|nr:hypothetical protein [Gemmatimonadota bacterium]
MEGLGGALGEALDLAGEFFHSLAGEPSVPSVGTYLRASRELRLSGRDRRSAGDAHGFVVDLPRESEVRVVHLTGIGGDGLWVQPTRPDAIELVPEESRRFAAAYGFALEVSPGLLMDGFEIVSESPNSR